MVMLLTCQGRSSISMLFFSGYFSYRKLKFLAIVPLFIIMAPTTIFAARATTTITVTICGDGAVNFGEVCDDGAVNNDGAYSSSILLRRCNAVCTGYGPYCGDFVLQSYYSETCDDGNNLDGDNCDALCIQEVNPITEGGGSTGGGGGGGGPGLPPGTIIVLNPTKVIIEGKAYPGSDVNILKDGSVVGVVRASGAADFLFETSNVTPGATTFGFWAEDTDGLRSIAFTTTFQVTENAVTTVSGVFLPPTIEIDQRAVKPGEIINLSGQTVPNVGVNTHINSETEFIEFSTSTSVGKWNLDFNTINLERDEFHTAKAFFELVIDDENAEVKSGFSQSVSFYVGDKEISDIMTADLNVDGKVNLIDFSILLFHWGTGGGESDPPADINLSGKVDLTDFSIMLFNWTG